MAGETVLIVDDRDDSLSFLREYVLGPNGYLVVEAHNGVEAMQLIQTQHVDLIISDLVMPKMGGLELLGESAAERSGYSSHFDDLSRFGRYRRSGLSAWGPVTTS